jgi:hypothetical protein
VVDVTSVSAGEDVAVEAALCSPSSGASLLWLPLPSSSGSEVVGAGVSDAVVQLAVTITVMTFRVLVVL